MIMLDMEVISFALDSSANQSAATGSERANKNEIYSPAPIQLPDEFKLNWFALPSNTHLSTSKK